MTAPPPPAGPLDPGLSDRMQQMVDLVESADPVVTAMTAIRAKFMAQGWQPGQASEATLLLWKASLLAVEERRSGDTGAAGAPQ